MSPLPSSERDLAAIASATDLDHALRALAGVAAAGGAYTLGLLVNGMTVYGQVASPSGVFKQLDEENERMIARGERKNPGSWPEDATEKVRGIWMRVFEDEEERHRQLMRRNPKTSVADMTEDDARQTIGDRENVLTLSQVHVFPPGGARFEVPLMRIRLANVSAWWVVPSDENGGSSFQHPGP